MNNLHTQRGTESLKLAVHERLGDELYLHSVGTAKTAATLAELYGHSRRLAELAGLLHDIGRSLGQPAMIEIITRNGILLEGLETEEESRVDAPAGAAIAREDFGVTDRSVLEAIRYHTTGVVGMCGLANCVFAADFVEEGRGHEAAERLRNQLTSGLDRLVISVLGEKIAYVQSEGKRVDPRALKLFALLQNDVGRDDDASHHRP
jgi:predicted HD superfamily hydrolase involved in NAD metabolism